MSDTDSFINEVTEEVRREKLYSYLRRYGWIGIASVVLLVGGAAFNEFRNAQERDAAQATGDALLTALEQDAPEDRAAALAGVSAQGSAAAVTLLLQAATLEESGDFDAAATTLGQVTTNGEIPQMYRDIAAFKSAMLPVGDPASRSLALQALAAPGQPFSLLAQEQLAYIALDSGDTDGALEMLRRIEEDAGTSRGLRERVQTLMVALGEELPAPVTE